MGDDNYRPGHGWVGLRQGGERVWRLVPSALWDHSQVQGLLSFATRSDVAMATWLGSAKEQCRVRPPRGSRTAGAAADTRQTLHQALVRARHIHYSIYTSKDPREWVQAVALLSS